MGLIRRRWEAWMGFLYITYAMPLYAEDADNPNVSERNMKARRLANRVEVIRRTRCVGDVLCILTWVVMLFVSIRYNPWVFVGMLVTMMLAICIMYIFRAAPVLFRSKKLYHFRRGSHLADVYPEVS